MPSGDPAGSVRPEPQPDGSPLSGVQLSETVEHALRVAADQTPQHTTLHTARVLDALARVDVLGQWDRLWFRTGNPATLQVLDPPDPDGHDRPSQWHGVELSTALVASLQLLARMAQMYEMVPVQPGALALALIADPACGAARSLLASGELTHEELLRTVQVDLLGVELPDLNLLLDGGLQVDDNAGISAQPSRRERLATVAAGREPDDLDLLQVLLAETNAGQLPSGILVEDVVLELVDTVRTLGVRPVPEVLAAAEKDVESDGWQLLLALTEHPSPACAALLKVAGVSGPEVAVDIRLHLEDADRERKKVSNSTVVLSVVDLVLTLAVPTLIVRHVLGPGSWWELLLIPLVFQGPPAVSSGFTAAIAVPLYFLVTPLAAAMQLADAFVGWVRERAERRMLWSRTGIRLGLGPHRRHLQRHSSIATRARMLSGAVMPYRAMRLRRSVKRVSPTVGTGPR